MAVHEFLNSEEFLQFAREITGLVLGFTPQWHSLSHAAERATTN